MLQGAKILITGHTGQVGGGIAAGVARGNQVYGLARYTAPGSRERAAALGITPIVCDFTTGDFTGVPDDCDYVLHVAGNLAPESVDRGMVDHAEGAALLMHHCRKAKAFLYVSTTGVYFDHPDPWHEYTEDDRLGGHALYPAPHYGPTKVGGEGAVRGLARVLGLPTMIARLNGAYGASGNGGTMGMILEDLVAGRPIDIPEGAPRVFSPIHEDDVAAFMGPLLAHAAVPATICNLGGDEAVSTERCARFMGAITGIEPQFNRVRDMVIGFGADPTRRRQLAGDCTYTWRTGIRRMIAARHPEIALRPDPE